VHIKKGVVYRIDGNAASLTDKLLLKPKLSPAEAKTKVEAVLKGEMKTELVILAEEGETAKLVYEIEVLEGLNRKYVFVNADNGETEKVLEGSPTSGL
jgi:uncharacterized membrane protein YkoI